MKNTILRILFWWVRIPAGIILKKFKPQIIAVTGSYAKTSTKEAIFQVLKIKFKGKIGKSWGNLNNELGLPLAILGFKKTPFVLFWPLVILSGFIKAVFLFKYPKVLVLEYAADKPGDIEYLTSLAKPFGAVVTNVGSAHLEFFKSRARIALEKGKLVENLPKNGFAILNQKDPWVEKMKFRTKAKVVFFKPGDFNLPQKAALKVAEVFKINKIIAQKALREIKPLKGRLQLIKAKNQIQIIDDTYNSNPESANIALNFLDHSEAQRKVAVLGEMLELGFFSKEAHLKIGQNAKKIVDFLVVVGENSKQIPNIDLWYPDSRTASLYLPRYLKKGDLVLVKGSRAMKMERIVQALI